MSLSKLSGKLFTHNCTFTGYGNGTPYLYYKAGGGVVDGIKRMHLQLYSKCDICDKEVLVAMTHVQEDGKIYDSKEPKPLNVHTEIDPLTIQEFSLLREAMYAVKNSDSVSAYQAKDFFSDEANFEAVVEKMRKFLLFGSEKHTF